MKLPTKPHIGLKSNELLKMRGRSRIDAVAPPQWIELGKSAVWHYQDCSIVLEHDGQEYRVKEIVENVG